MKKICLLSLVIFLLAFSPLVAAGELKPDLSDIIAKTPAAEKVSVIMLFHERPTPADISIIKSDGASVKYQYTIIDAVAAQVPAQAADKIAKRAFVKLVEPDYKVKLVLDKSIPQIQANKVWEAGITGKNIDVAVLDTGIHDEHPSLTIEKEVDYTGEGTDDLYGHGTHVAGIIASTDSTYRGVAYDSDLFNVKVLNKDGSGYGSDVIKGIEWSVDNGAEIISMSLGAEIDPCDGTDAISQAVDKAVSKGVIAIVAAGNSGPDSGTITSPGCSKRGITVGAVDDNDNVPSWSSRGPTDDGRVKPDLVAPGVGITSTWKDNSFKSLSGTSMSTPHVSGVAALLLETDSSLKPDDVKNVLKTTAIDLGLDENTQGAGRVDAYKAYIYVANVIKEPENETEENKTKTTPPGFEREVSDPGFLPDSPFYFLKGWGRTIRMFCTFDLVKKAELELKFANEDALTIEKLCDKGECELAEKFCEKFQERFQRTIQRMEKAKQNGKDVEALIEKLTENHLRQQQVLARALEKVPEQAKEGILKAIENSSIGLENAIENVQGKHKMEQFREELNLQIRNMGEETQLRIQERLERKRHEPEEVPVGEPQQQEPQQQEPQQQEPQQQEPQQQEPQQQEPTQKGPGK